MKPDKWFSSEEREHLIIVKDPVRRYSLKLLSKNQSAVANEKGQTFQIQKEISPEEKNKIKFNVTIAENFRIERSHATHGRRGSDE